MTVLSTTHGRKPIGKAPFAGDRYADQLDDRDVGWEAELVAAWEPPSGGEPLVPFRDWIGAQTAWFRCQAEESEQPSAAALIAGALEQLGGAIDFHAVGSVSELLAVPTTRYRGADLVGLGLCGTAERRHSRLAEEIDRETARYLRQGGDAALLVAYALDLLAGQAEDLGASEAQDFLLLHAALENALWDTFLSDELEEVL